MIYCAATEMHRHPNFELAWIAEVVAHNEDWDWDAISRSPNIDHEWLEGFLIKYNYSLLSKHPKLNYKWMNRCIGAPLDLKHISQTITKNDLLRVILKPTQCWGIEILSQRFGQRFCRWYELQDKTKKHLFEHWYLDTKQEYEEIKEVASES